MKIAIHKRKGSFSDRWIEYCEENKIPYKIVNCYYNDIIQQLSGCCALMWHHHHTDYKDFRFAKSILFSLEQAGIKVFPDFNTGWHFDDKVGQKYLLEAISAPLVPSYTFYDKISALEWAANTSFPKVFKLRGGAGSTNVKLVRNLNQCEKIITKAFGEGFSQHDSWYGLKDIINKYKEGKATVKNVLGALVRIIYPKEFETKMSREKEYVYFQEFIPNNDSDIRVIVIGNKAFGIKRMIRKNDFRASGSGNILFDKKTIPIDCVKVAFEINKSLKSQCTAFDFVMKDNMALIVEISYGFASKPYDNCPGYWTSDLEWHNGKFNPQGWMVEGLINNL